MAEYASKGVAGTGLALGITGTALGVLAGSGSGSGLLGGLFGGGSSQYATKEELSMAQELANKDHQIAALTAEKYTDSQVQAAMMREADINASIKQMAIDNERAIAVIKTEAATTAATVANHASVIDRVASEVADARVREATMNGKIDMVAATASQGIAVNSAAIQCLQNTVAGITKTVVPNTSVCPGWGSVTITPTTTTTTTTATTGA